MISKLKDLRNSEFSRNVLTLSSGTAVAQVLPILISPILTRMYSPDQFATFGLFTALIGILGIVSTGKYEFAIMLPQTDREAYSVAALAILIVIAFGLLIFLSIVIFHAEIVAFFNNPDLGIWLYMVPLGMCLTGLFQVFSFLSNREKSYTILAKSRVARSLITAVINIAFGYLKVILKALQALGLIAGLLVGQLLEILILQQGKRRWSRLWMSASDHAAIRTVAKRYVNFPKFDVSSELMVTASIQLPVLLFNRFFDKSVVGYYFHAHRVLSVPMSMLGSAVGQILYRQLANVRQDEQAFANLVKKTYQNLILIAVVPYSVVGFFGEELFAFVFGTAWRQAGVYAEIIAPWLLFNFIGSPLTMIFSTLEKQRQMLFCVILMFAARAISMYVGIEILGDTYQTIMLFSLSGVLFYFLLNFYLVCFLSQVKASDFLRSTFGWPLLIVVFFASIKILYTMLST